MLLVFAAAPGSVLFWTRFDFAYKTNGRGAFQQSDCGYFLVFVRKRDTVTGLHQVLCSICYSIYGHCDTDKRSLLWWSRHPVSIIMISLSKLACRSVVILNQSDGCE